MLKTKPGIFLVAIVLFSTVLITSCSSDDDSPSQNQDNIVLNVEKADGSLFVNGEIITFNQLGSGNGRDDGKLKYFLKNIVCFKTLLRVFNFLSKTLESSVLKKNL